MQLGSGTVDLTPALTYLGGSYHWRYGTQLRYTRRLGENDAGYTLGDAARAAAWIHHPLGRFNVWLKGRYLRWGDIEGRDPQILTQMTMGPMTMKTSPTAYTRNYGGSRADLTLAADVAVGGPFTLGVELSKPVYQDLNGDAQMKTDYSAQLYLQMMY